MVRAKPTFINPSPGDRLLIVVLVIIVCGIMTQQKDENCQEEEGEFYKLSCCGLETPGQHAHVKATAKSNLFR